MDGSAKYFRFFRFRSGLDLNEGSEHWTLQNVAQSIMYCDVRNEDLVTESVTIGFCTKGGFGYSDILKMDFKLYLQLIKDIEPIRKSYEEESKGSK